jgi:hypothetical protein
MGKMEIVLYLGNPVYYAGRKNGKLQFHNPKALMPDRLTPALFATQAEMTKTIFSIGLDKCAQVAYTRFVPV